MEVLFNKIKQLIILLARIKTTLSWVKVYKMLTVIQKLLLGRSKEHVDNMIFFVSIIYHHP